MYRNALAWSRPALGLAAVLAAVLAVALAASLAGCARPAVRGAAGEPEAQADGLRGTAPVEERARTASFALG